MTVDAADFQCITRVNGPDSDLTGRPLTLQPFPHENRIILSLASSASFAVRLFSSFAASVSSAVKLSTSFN
jgi:hypothetical protein